VPSLRPVRLISFFVVSFAVVLTSMFPVQTEASVFSNIVAVFTKKTVPTEVEPRDFHSQTIPLPKPSHAVDLDKATADVQVVGGTALVADSGPLGTIVDITEGNKSGSISTYVVQKGDTIGEVAEKFNVSVNTIKWANELKGNALKLGQELVILPFTGVRYTVKNGGTIADIVKKYGGDSYEAARYNQVDEDEELKPGTVVLIPDGIDQTLEEETKIAINPKKPGVRVVRSGQTSRLHGAGGPAFPGYFVHPLAGLGTKTQGLHGFNGVDIGAARGTPVVASASGTVVVSKQPGWNGGYGGYVVLQHDNDTQTLYAHLSQNYASLGSRVSQGTEIGAVGNTGKSTGSHLHFEIRGGKNPF
jgi:murein DD-endopeptidase MepM/ murein hydrolase activator NlpD